MQAFKRKPLEKVDGQPSRFTKMPGEATSASPSLYLSILAALLIGIPTSAPAQAIPANGYPTYLVDAESAIPSIDGLSHPQGIALAPDGTAYVADTGNHRVLRFSPQGVQSTVSFGDLAPVLESPAGVALDSSGTLYVTDTATNRVVKLTAEATRGVTIVSAPLLNDPVSIAADAAGNLAIANTGNQTFVVRRGGGPAVVFNTGTTVVHAPQAVAFDTSGRLYVLDAGDNTSNGAPAIYRFPALGGTATNLTPQNNDLSGMDSITVDPQDSIFVSCRNNPSHNIFEVVNGGTRAVDIPGDINSPDGIALDRLGNVYATSSNAVTKLVYNNAANFGALAVGATSGSITFHFNFFEDTIIQTTHTIGGGAQGREYHLSPGSTCGQRRLEPAQENGSVVPASCSVNVLFKPEMVGGRPGALQLSTSNGSMTQLTTGTGLGAQLGLMNAAVSLKLPNVTVDNIAVNAADTELYFEANYNTYEMPTNGNVPKLISAAVGEIAVNGAGDVFIFTLPTVTRVPADGSASTTFTIPGLIRPSSAVMDYNGAIYVSDAGVYSESTSDGFVLRRSQTGEISKVLPGTWSGPDLMTADLDGNIFVDDSVRRLIFEVQVGDGSYFETYESPVSGGLNGVGPISLAVDESETLYFVNDDMDNGISLLYASPSGQQAPLPGHCYSLGACNLPLYTVPGLVNPTYGWLPFYPSSGIQAWATSASGKMYVANGEGNGAYLIDRTLGSIPREAFARGFQDFGGPTQDANVYNIGNQNLVFTGSDAAFTESGSGVGSFTFASSGGCEPGTVVAPGDYCQISVTDKNKSSAPTVTDGLHLLTNAVNNNSAVFRLEGPAAP